MPIKKVALFGGSFDPIHNSHIEIALQTIRQLSLDEVWFLPEKSHRKKELVVSYKDRLKMLDLATKDEPKLISDKLDMQKNGSDYSIETLKELKEMNQDTKFWMILGVDVMLGFDKWVKFQDFFPLTDFAVVNRPGYPVNDFVRFADNLSDKYKDFRYTIIDLKPSKISSSKIRNNLEKSKSDLPIEVYGYIKQKNLYN